MGQKSIYKSSELTRCRQKGHELKQATVKNQEGREADRKNN